MTEDQRARVKEAGYDAWGDNPRQFDGMWVNTEKRDCLIEAGFRDLNDVESLTEEEFIERIFPFIRTEEESQVSKRAWARVTAAFLKAGGIVFKAMPEVPVDTQADNGAHRKTHADKVGNIRKEELASWQTETSAMAVAVAQFTRFGFNTLVQCGTDVSGSLLTISNGERVLKVRVMGSENGYWSIAPKCGEGENCHDAIYKWLVPLMHKVAICLVQFGGVNDNEMPRMYLTTPTEIAGLLKTRNEGHGDTVLYEKDFYSKEPLICMSSWQFTKKNAERMFRKGV